MKYLRYRDLVMRGYVNNEMTLWRWIKSGRFPKPVRLGPNSRAWTETDIAAYDASLVAKRDGPKAA